MSATITATEANRQFSRILNEVEDGQTYVVTRQGRAIAKIVPADVEEVRREEARAKLFARLRSQPPKKVAPWTREELYEDDV